MNVSFDDGSKKSATAVLTESDSAPAIAEAQGPALKASKVQPEGHTVPGAFGRDMNPTVTFAELGLCEPILQTLIEQEYTKPTPIQAAAIPVAMTGKDILGSAQTGTGKTAAFALPILHRLETAPVDKSRSGPLLPRALILAPTRELAQQILESFKTYGKYTTLCGTAVFGGVSMFHQIRALRAGIDVLVGTPGRLMDLMNQGHINLSKVEIFVLDEADRMLDMGFIHDIKKIASELPAAPAPRQTLLFSATMPSEIKKLAQSLLKNPQQIAMASTTSTATRIKQQAYAVDRSRKLGLLAHLMGAEMTDTSINRAVVFTRTKFGAERLARQLDRLGISCDAIHGDKAQNQRKKALESFKRGSVRALIATDVAARGLDVDDVTHVFNFDLPEEPEAYVHRIGRTGRAAASGIAISFVAPDDFEYLRVIQRVTKANIEMITQLPQGLPKTPKPEFIPGDRAVMPEDRGMNSGGGYGGGRPASRRAGAERSHHDEMPRGFAADHNPEHAPSQRLTRQDIGMEDTRPYAPKGGPRGGRPRPESGFGSDRGAPPRGGRPGNFNDRPVGSPFRDERRDEGRGFGGPRGRSSDGASSDRRSSRGDSPRAMGEDGPARAGWIGGRGERPSGPGAGPGRSFGGGGRAPRSDDGPPRGRGGFDGPARGGSRPFSKGPRANAAGGPGRSFDRPSDGGSRGGFDRGPSRGPSRGPGRGPSKGPGRGPGGGPGRGGFGGKRSGGSR